MAIRYKVVIKETRKSMFVQPPYTKIYRKGELIKAVEGSLGIMVFRRRWQAEQFIKKINYARFVTYLIVRVEVFSRGKSPSCISRWVTFRGELEIFYLKCFPKLRQNKLSKTYVGFTKPPNGTLCYDMVRVID